MSVEDMKGDNIEDYEKLIRERNKVLKQLGHLSLLCNSSRNNFKNMSRKSKRNIMKQYQLEMEYNRINEQLNMLQDKRSI